MWRSLRLARRGYYMRLSYCDVMLQGSLCFRTALGRRGTRSRLVMRWTIQSAEAGTNYKRPQHVIAKETSYGAWCFSEAELRPCNRNQNVREMHLLNIRHA
jgi:hypothetical protein